ncbi:MAG TPA: MarR family transcriptional regulator [Candidatus Limnocylindrales bacterium]|nr:MarR family transcriptional regulator [Candidatus Limnocylindrales bacterium]
MIRRPDSRLSLLFDLFAANQQVRTLLGHALANSGLSADEYAVYSILFDEGPHAPSELARRAGMPPTTMTHYVRSMLERGHVERAPSSSDRRSYRLVLTAAGILAHGRASRAFDEAHRRFIGALTVDEVEAGTVLRAVGRAAAVAEHRLTADSVDATA